MGAFRKENAATQGLQLGLKFRESFGDEMWSARGIGKQRLEKSIAVRQGQVIKFVIEASDDNSKAKQKARAEKAAREAKMTSRLQAELAKEVDAAKEAKPKGKLF